MSRFGILSTMTRPVRLRWRHTMVRFQRKWFDFWIKRRLKRKLNLGKSLHAVVVIHEPRSYSAISSMIDEMKADSRFNVTVLAVYYRHGVFTDNFYHDGGAVDYLTRRGIVFQKGTDIKGNFIDIKTLNPDIVIFQTPYNQYLYPKFYGAELVSRYAFIMYTPYYGISMSDSTKSITHLPSFFQYVRYVFMASDFDCDDIKKRVPWCCGLMKVFNGGCSKFAYIFSEYVEAKSAWNLSQRNNRFRVLWTPRWNLDEGTSHFFDYWKILLNWARENKERVDFVFRPHPLMFNHLIKTNRMTDSQLFHIRNEFSITENAHIDENDEYKDTLLGADCLIADPTTSMSLEFVVQNKPVIYTANTDNDECQFAQMLLPGFYVVNTEQEMIDRLNQLLQNNEDENIRLTRTEIVDKLMRPLNDKPLGLRAIDAIMSDLKN